MYYWTDHEPLKRTAVFIPANLDDRFPAPVFRYRGFFINDEDLLTGWAPGTLRNRGNFMKRRDMLKLSPLALASSAAGHFAFSQSPEAVAAEALFNVRTYGVAGDGKTGRHACDQ